MGASSGYSKGRKSSKPVRALQDFAIGQVLGKEALAVDLPALASTFSVGGADRSGADSCGALALQDSAPIQHAMVVGLIATLMGRTLVSDTLAPLGGHWCQTL